jgi:hypothetical protein
MLWAGIVSYWKYYGHPTELSSNQYSISSPNQSMMLAAKWVPR